MTDTTATPATFTALYAKAQATDDYPRVTLPSGLSGRVAMARSTEGRYAISLLGFGVGDINVNAVVDADADVTTEVDAALRARPDFIASLRHRQANPRLAPGSHGLSPLEQGRDRWLATLTTHLPDHHQEEPVTQTQPAPATAEPFATAERLAPVPDHDQADPADWIRHYAALALAAYATFDRSLRQLPPDPEKDSRPDLGYLVALGNAALAAAVALIYTPQEAARTLWWVTPEQGALNGEWAEWITAILDEHGINPADIDPRYNSGDFRSPASAEAVTR